MRIIDHQNKNIKDVLWGGIFYILLIITGFVSPEEVLIIYVLESLIIGLYHFIKLLASGVAQRKNGEGFFMSLFFLVHYGAFCFGQLYFFFYILELYDDKDWNIFEKTFHFVNQREVFISLLILLVIYGYKTWNSFFRIHKQLRIDLVGYMFYPYGRIFIQQLVAVFPYFIFGFFEKEIFAAVVLSLLRLVIDYCFYLLKNNPDTIIKYLARDKNTGQYDSFKARELKDFFNQVSDE